MILVLWANQYNMSHGELSTCLNKLLTILETVEASIETQAAAANKETTANAKAELKEAEKIMSTLQGWKVWG
jgi:hypothetical protein